MPRNFFHVGSFASTSNSFGPDSSRMAGTLLASRPADDDVARAERVWAMLWVAKWADGVKGEVVWANG